MNAVLDDSVGFDEPAVQTQSSPANERNALAITQDMTRVQNALGEFDRVSAGLADLERRYPKDAIYEVGTTKGMKDAVEHRAAWREPRITVEKARKMAKAPLLALGKNVDARAAWLTEKLREGEEPIDALIKVEESRREAEKQARINAEAGRVMKIQEALADIAQDVLIACSKTSTEIASLLGSMRSAQPDPLVFQECMEQARAAWASAIAKLETAHKAKLWEEAEQRRIEEERAAEATRRAEEDARIARITAEQEAHAQRLKEQEEALAAQRQADEDRRAAERAELDLQRAELEALRAAVSPQPAPLEVVTHAPAVLELQPDTSPDVLAWVGEERAVAAPSCLPDDAPLETSEAEACEVPAAMVAQVVRHAAIFTGGRGHTAPEVSAALRFVLTAFEGKFPSHPKPSAEWWATLRTMTVVAIERVEGDVS